MSLYTSFFCCEMSKIHSRSKLKAAILLQKKNTRMFNMALHCNHAFFFVYVCVNYGSNFHTD